jgi:hypothetical protein
MCAGSSTAGAGGSRPPTELQPGCNAERTVASRRAREYARVVAGFASGAASAAVVTSYVDFWAAFVPLAVIALAARRELVGALRLSVAR